MKNVYQELWESKSSLRTCHRKLIDFSVSGDFFPQDKQVLFLLPEISGLDNQKKKEILILSFYNYLQEINQLESSWVCRACNNIIYQSFDVVFSEEMKLNALTILMDEYYHLYVASDYMQQLKQKYPNLSLFNQFFSDSSHAMTTIKERLNESCRDIFEILGVCIFETTLIKELVNFFDSPSIHPSVHEYVNDHMNDESRHHVYFKEMMRFIWESMPKDYQNNIGLHLGDFVTLYLNIEGQKSFNKQILNWVMEDNEQALKSINNLYYGFEITGEMPIVKNVIHILKKTNIISHPSVLAGFQKNKLLV